MDASEEWNEILTHVSASLWDDKPNDAAEALLYLAMRIARAGLPTSIFTNYRNMCICDAEDTPGCPPFVAEKLKLAERELHDERKAPKSRIFH